LKETLKARSEYDTVDGKAVHRVDGYQIGDEIGRGSFGAVHLAVDEMGNEYVCILQATEQYSPD
jgi:calcium/calmodulin-dependent protein kinase kinase 2